MVVGVCRVTLMAPQCHSLKEKRSVVRTIRDRVAARFKLSLVEVGGLDTWQRAVLGLAVVGVERDAVHVQLARIVGAIEGMGLAQVVGVERDVLGYGDEAFGVAGQIAGMSAGAGRARGADTPDDGTDGGPEEPVHEPADDLSWVPASWLAAEDPAPDSRGSPAADPARDPRGGSDGDR